MVAQEDDILGVVSAANLAGTPPSRPTLSVVYLDIVRLMIKEFLSTFTIELLKCRNAHMKYLRMSG